MIIIQPKLWAEGWGMDESSIPFRLINGVWIEQAPIGTILKNPKMLLNVTKKENV